MPRADVAARLPPVSQGLRHREVFTSSTSGEGMTSWAWTGEPGLTEVVRRVRVAMAALEAVVELRQETTA
jgi:hypothetical protein